MAVRLQAGKRATAEDALAFALTAAGIPFVRQYPYVPGRRFAADFAFPAARVLAEVQGGVYNGKAHGSITGVLADMERGNLAALHGWRVVRVTPDMVTSGAALATIEEVLNAAKED